MVKAATRNQSLSNLRELAVPRGLATAHPIFVARAREAQLWDVDGNEYIDFAGGIGVLNVGHAHPRVVQAVQAQLERLTHTSFQVAMYEPYLRVAERLNSLTPGEFSKKTILFSTGIEAIENAVKIARSYTRRPALISFAGGFHGRTLLGMSLTGKVNPYRKQFGPLAPEVYHAPYPYEYRGWSTERSLEALQELFTTSVSPESVAAFVIEPVLGEAGFIPAPADYLRELRRIADEHGILLVADEIQSGFGRTGRFLAIEHSSVVPDLVATAKSLAGGMPLSALTGRAEVMDAPAPGSLGGTYAGNPLSCAAALAVLDIFEEEDLLSKAQRLAEQLRSGFRQLQERFDCIGDVRGLGPMLALELVRDRATKEPDGELVGKVLEKARAGGLLLLKAGLHDNVLREAAPLNTPPEIVGRALIILEQSFSEVCS